MEDDFPFHFGMIFRFQPLIFQGVKEIIPPHFFILASLRVKELTIISIFSKSRVIDLGC